MDDRPAAQPLADATLPGPSAVPIAAIFALSFAAFASAASLRVTDPSLTRIAGEYAVALAVASYVITSYALAYGETLLRAGRGGDCARELLSLVLKGR